MEPIGIRTRPLADILARLRAPVPPELVERTKKPGGVVDTINVWIVHDLLDFRAPGWSESSDIVPTPRGDIEHVVTLTIVGRDGELSRTGVANGDPNDTDDPKQPGDAATNGHAAAFKRAAAALGMGRQLWLKDRPRGWNLDWDTPVQYAAADTGAPPPAVDPAGGTDDRPAPVRPATAVASVTRDLDVVVPGLDDLGADADDFRAMFDMSAGDADVQNTIAAGAQKAVDAYRGTRDAIANPPSAPRATLPFDPPADPGGPDIDFSPAPWDPPNVDPADLDPPGPLGVVSVEAGGKLVDAATGEIVGNGATQPPAAAKPKAPTGSTSAEWEPRLSGLATPAEVDAWRGEIAAWAGQTSHHRHADAVWGIFWKNKARVLALAIGAARTTDELKDLARQVEDVPAVHGRQDLKDAGRAAWDTLTGTPAAGQDGGDDVAA